MNNSNYLSISSLALKMMPQGLTILNKALVYSFVFMSSLVLSQTNSTLENRLLLASPSTIAADNELSTYMLDLAQEGIKEHCATCHGDELNGASGVPNLVDNDWLWGVTGMEVTSVEAVMEIMQTITYGIRDNQCLEETKRYGACPDTRFSQMPAYGVNGYSIQQVNDLTDYLLHKNGQEIDQQVINRAESLWPICVECHGDDGYGYKSYGGPNLMDSVWLFGDSRTEIYDVIFNGRTQSCPAWGKNLSAVTIKALSVYLYNRSNGI